MFLYTAEYWQYYRGLILVTQFLLLLIASLLLVWISTPDTNQRLPNRIRLSLGLPFAFWYSDVLLWQVFWPCWIGLNTLVFLVDSLAKLGITSVLIWDTTQLLVFVVLYWWCISVWRSSANTRLKLWAFLARLMVVVSFLEIAHRVYVRINFPREFFNCNDGLFNFRNCF